MDASNGAYITEADGYFQQTEMPYYDPSLPTPYYDPPLPIPNPPNTFEYEDQKRCPTGIPFIKSLPGILNIIILIAFVCVLISTGITSRYNVNDADRLSNFSSIKLSAASTRDAILAFTVIGAILIIIDTFLYMTTLIKRFTTGFDVVFIIVMLVFSAILLILGCCAAAWDKKMNDTVGSRLVFVRRGAPAAAAFFIFIAMIAIIVNYGLRLMRLKGSTGS